MTACARAEIIPPGTLERHLEPRQDAAVLCRVCAIGQPELGGENKHSDKAAGKGAVRAESSWGRVSITQREVRHLSVLCLVFIWQCEIAVCLHTAMYGRNPF